MQTAYAKIIEYTKQHKPLVHCLTNNVTINDAANAILAVGGSPIMSEHPMETEEITAKANTLVINIGNFSDAKMESIFLSGKVARECNVPVVFDPVGVTSSKIRRSVTDRIIKEIQPKIIKGNMSEIKAIANIAASGFGVDVHQDDVTDERTLETNCQIAYRLARELDCVIVASGAIDIVATPQTVYSLHNGTPMLANITGTGCMSGMLMGVYAASGDFTHAAVLATSRLNIAGELAQEYVDKHRAGLGTFKVKLFDYLSTMDIDTLAKRGKIKCINCI